MICKSCGHELDDNAVFCTNCGKKLNEPVEETAETAAPAAEETVPEAAEAPVEAAPETAEETSAPEPEVTVEETAPIAEETPAPVEEPAPEAVPEPVQPEVSEPVISAPETPVSEPAPIQQPEAEPVQGIIPPPPVFEAPPVQPVPEQPQFAPYTEPLQEAPVTEPVVESTEKIKTKVGAGRLTFAAIVTVLAICFLLIGNMVLCVKFGATGKVLSKRIKKLNMQTVLSAEYENEEIATDLYKTLGIRSITGGNADPASFKAYLVKSNLREYIAGNVKAYANYIFEGKGGDPSISAADFAEEFFGDSDNNQIAYEEFGDTFNAKNIKTITKNLEKQNVDKALSIKKWNDEAGFNVKNCRHIFAFATLAILYGIVLVLLICIILIVDKQGKHVMGFYRTIFAIGGLISFFVGLAVIVVAPVMFTFTGDAVLYIFSNILFTFGLVSLCAGAAEIILGFIFNAVRRKLKKKAKLAKAAAAAFEKE